MIKWMTENRGGITIGVAALLLLITAFLTAGCQLDQMIKFDPPAPVAKALELPESIPLADGEIVWETWETWVQGSSKQLADRIGDAHQRWNVIASLAETGLGIASSHSGTFPGGTLLFGMLAAGAGLFFKKPGTDKFVSREKEDSYNAGISKGKEVAIRLLGAKADEEDVNE